MRSTVSNLITLFVDTADAVVERGRIKAQQNRIKEIMGVDKQRLQRVYAEIGKIQVNGGSKQKQEVFRKEAVRIEARLQRAEERLKMLRASDSVDECTEAFRQQLAEAFDKVVDSAKEKGAEASEKIRAASAEVSVKAKEKANELSDKTKAKAKEMGNKAKEKGAKVSEKAKAKADEISQKAKDAVKANFEQEKEADKTDAKAEDISAEDIMKRIREAIDSVDEETADADNDTDAESAEEFTF